MEWKEYYRWIMKIPIMLAVLLYGFIWQSQVGLIRHMSQIYNTPYVTIIYKHW